MKAKWLALFLLAGGGCETTNTIVQAAPDLAGFPPVGCTPMAKECVTSTLARVCPADGSAWLAVQCSFGETCTDGDCAVDVGSVPCSSADNFCTSDTTALVCNDNGQGFHMKMCPANTQCVNGGDCAGSCLIGQSQCLDVNTALNCADGNTLTPSPCPSGQACSDNVGGCAPAACTPNNCNAECGNKATDPNSTDSNFFSFCSDTPLGWKWITVPCAAPKTCSPAIACSAQALSDACTSECIPNEVRCSDDGLGTQTCGMDGKFGPVVQCPGVVNGKKCVTDASGIPLGCGDTICDNGGIGICVLDAGVSKVRPCNASGNLEPVDRLATCTVGFCFEDPALSLDPFTGHRPAACTTVCQSGDSQCVLFDSALQNCDGTTGNWSPTTTPCLDGANSAAGCFPFTLNGRPRAVCGVCTPGDVRCAGPNASPSPGPTAFAQNCGLNGQWSANVACVASHCATDTGCVADCIPTKQVCVNGDPDSPSPEPVAFGKAGFHNCTTDGQIGPGPSPCPAGQSCRKDASGNSYGCVVCVGTVNEAGTVDTHCSTGPAGVDVCKPTNDGYQNVQACPAGQSCIPEGDPRDFVPESCDLTATDLVPFNETCEDNIFGNLGPPISCGGFSDCCTDACNPAEIPAPAICVP